MLRGRYWPPPAWCNAREQRADADQRRCGGLLEVQRFGAGRHALLQFVDHLLRITEQEGFGEGHASSA